jgi:hypothetical protein
VGTVAQVSSDSDGNSSWGPWYASDPPTAPFEPIKGPQPQQYGQQQPYGQPTYQPNAQQPSYTGQQPPYGQQPQQSPPPPYRMPSAKPPRRQRSRRLVYGLIAGGVAVVAAISAGVVFISSGGSTPHPTGFLPTGSSPGQDAQQITTAFVNAWGKGDLAQASKYTDHPAAALAALEANQKYLNLRKLSGTTQSSTIASGAGTREQVTFALTAQVATSAAASALTGSWSYHSSLVAYQETNSQWWYIQWKPDVIAPNLTNTTHLAAITVAPQVVAISDAQGNDLTSYHDAGLTNIAALLMKSGSAGGRGKPGLFVEIQTNKGKAVPNSQAVVVAPSNIPNLATTIDANAEQAARAAVAKHNGSAMVVIQPSTGKILAIANNAQENDFALTAQVAPGSTMKVITSTALFNEGVLTPQTGVECPPTFTIQGITYHNDNNETLPAGTPFMTDFAQSCNNAFTTQWSHLYGKLASTAHDYYGLNQKWDIGIANLSASYFNAPANASGAQLAEEAFGQGSLIASPIAMASVAATVDEGSFHQPILVDGTKTVTAKPLPSSTDTDLKEVMRAVVTSGTAAGLGLGPDVYAKTGTADVTGQGQPNSWFVAFDPSKDVAVGCVVLNAGYGAQFAGPETASFLSAY